MANKLNYRIRIVPDTTRIRDESHKNDFKPFAEGQISVFFFKTKHAAILRILFSTK
jgi:hypothetical protein